MSESRSGGAAVMGVPDEEKLTALTDAEVVALLSYAIKLHDVVQSEHRRRIERRLQAAYGHELRWVVDIWAGTEDRAWNRDNPSIAWCFYCGERPGWQRDHKTPKSRGGSDSEANIARCCMTCNVRKNAMTVDEYRASLERRSGVPHVFYGERTAGGAGV